jgi:RecT family
MEEALSNVAVIDPKAPRPPLVAGGRPTAIVPQTMEEAYRFANAVVQSGMAPPDKETPEKAMIAIMRGMEVGLTPFQALDKIAVINGRTTIWGDAAIGLVRGSGLCEYVREWIDGEGEKRIAYCETRRKGEPFPVTRSFSVDEAKKARLWGKAGPWTQFDARMLQMRARGFALRDVYADVLGGLYLREEVDEDMIEARRAPAPPAPPTPPAPPAAIAAKEAYVPPDPGFHERGEAVEAATPAAAIDYGATADAYEADANAAKTVEQLDAAWFKHVDPMITTIPRDVYDRVSAIEDVRRGALEE